MEIRGKIIKQLPLRSGEGRNGTWKIQEYVLEYGDRYPKILCFSLRGEKVDQYPLNIDEEVTVSFDVESREYNGKYYTDVKAWKIDRNAGAPQQNAPQAAPAAPAAPAANFSNDNSNDDLPF